MIGNYSLADQLAGVGLTPLGEDVLNDPRAMQRMGNDLAGMSAYQPQGGVLLDAEPAGAVYGQQGASFFSATPEDDTNVVVKAIQTVLGAPFNLLRAGKEGLEEVIGHPYAAQREMQDDRAEMIAHMLADSDKAMVGMPFDRGGINARQTNTSTVATGQATGIQPVLTPRKTGIVELFTGENRKRRAREMMALQEAMKLRGVQLDWSKTGSEILKNNAGAYQSYQAGEGERIKNEWMPSNMLAYQDVQYSQAEQNRAAAGAQRSLSGKYSAEGGLANARADQVRTLTPSIEYRNYAAGNRSQAAADKDWTLLPTQAVTETYKAARERARVEKEVATGVNSPAVARAAADSASKLNAELAKVRKGPGYMFGTESAMQRERDVYSTFGVPEIMDPQGKGTGQFDVEAWRKTLVPEKAESKSTDEIIAGILQSIEEMKRKFDTGEKTPPTVAEPASEPVVNTDSWTPQQWDADIPQGATVEEAIEHIVTKGRKSRKQAADIVRMIAAAK